MLSASFGDLVGLARPDRSSPDPREASGWGRWRLKVTRLEVALPHLPPALDGFRMVQISDLHLEPFTKPKHILQVVAACTALAPDLVVMTGDFVTHSAHSIGLLAELLGPLQPPYGVHACLGNHDFWCDPVAVEKALQERNLGVLRNETRRIHTDRGVIQLAGMDSRYVGKPELRATLARVNVREPLIILMHEPDVVDDFAAAGLEALQLSGHTHGGQLRFLDHTPMAFRRPRWGKNYLAGHYTVGSMQLYVNRGIGCVGVPLRVSCPPEITEITLRSPLLHWDHKAVTLV
ncbi:MAG: metallophosphoesterase [Verrucomicrobiales bacterium]|nr:metallophosphoesterase [Verrucomicrobiales bacterium]